VRQQLERLRGADLVPESIVVAGDDAEHVLARRQARVVRRAARIRFDPIRLVAFELVTEVDALRREHAHRCVMELPVRAVRRRAQLAIEIERLTVANDAFEYHRRR
jgi:hypothetical protein